MTKARIFGAGLALFAFLIATAEAKLYKWVDDQGVTHYGETIPPEYADKSNVQFSDEGRVIKKNERPSPAEQRAKSEAEAKNLAEDKAVIERRRKDNMLLNTFSNENEIDLARDRNLQQVDAVIKSIQALQKSAQQNLANFLQEAANRTAAGKKIPDSLQADISETEIQTAKLQQDLTKAQEKSAAVRANYEADKLRYRELTGSSSKK